MRESDSINFTLLLNKQTVNKVYAGLVLDSLSPSSRGIIFKKVFYSEIFRSEVLKFVQSRAILHFKTLGLEKFPKFTVI